MSASEKWAEPAILPFCPSCGGSIRAETIGWKCEKCGGFIDMQGDFHEHTEKPFLPPMTKADSIRAMSDEELAEFLSKADFYCKTDCEKCLRGTACIPMLQWLKQPAEEAQK